MITKYHLSSKLVCYFEYREIHRKGELLTRAILKPVNVHTSYVYSKSVPYMISYLVICRSIVLGSMNHCEHLKPAGENG